VKNFRLRHAGGARGAKQPRLDREPGTAACEAAFGAAWRTPHRELSLAGLGVDDDPVRLLAGTAGESIARAKSAKAGETALEQVCERRLDIAVRLHAAPPRARVLVGSSIPARSPPLR